MEKRGWYCRYLRKEYGPYATEREAIEFAQNCEFTIFSTYYGHFFNYQKHKRYG